MPLPPRDSRPALNRQRSAVRELVSELISPVLPNLEATLAAPAAIGRNYWPRIDALHPDMERISKRHAPSYVPYDGFTVSASAAVKGVFVVESITATVERDKLSRDLILLSLRPQDPPIRYASGHWSGRPETRLWLPIRNAGQIFGPLGEYGFVMNGTKWDAPWHVQTSPSSSSFSEGVWFDVAAWWQSLKPR